MELGVPGLRGRISKIPHPLTNLAGDARFSDLEADAKIAKVRDRYGGMTFGWVTGPSSRPTNLPLRLEAAGLTHAESLAGMALSDLTRVIEVNPRVRVDEVTDHAGAATVTENAPERDDHFFVVPKVIE